ncbi:MAG TPA: hypothetical protein DCR43_01740 [Bacteroidales bacterium]|nr:MAG: hypothetical protein A2X11_10505 [Bacteroidetes bacterium GWE2_42_24]OFY28110.1 MAG: hypothetical protein A2X09_00765 [Bacteroidetes bacterium GWF2_43_11]HAQ64572.1 hypothetical protein [Bacteroidales bacterium]HBZ65490.1 hypothetical protein [Bacteroidales bacterium]
MIIGIILLVLPALAYLTLLGWLTVVLKRGLSGMPPDRRGEPTVSVLVAARNEAARIGDLIGQLARQDYPRHLYEVVLADDHSTDQSVAEALKASAITGFSLKVCSPGELRGKRAALDAAVGCAHSDWFAFTDADTLPGVEWISRMMTAVTNESVVLVLGSIDMVSDGTWFGKMQAAEYQSIAALTAATAFASVPVMANGASMLVRADVYRKAVTDTFQKGYASGDDMFLLEYVQRHYGSGSIACQVWEEGRVVIRPEPTVAAFFHQRLRWASKAGGYTDPTIVSISLLVVLTNLSIVVSLFGALLAQTSWWLPVLLYGIKTIADAPLLFVWSDHTGNLRLVFTRFLLLQLLYPFYAIGTGLAGLTVTMRWK